MNESSSSWTWFPNPASGTAVRDATEAQDELRAEFTSADQTNHFPNIWDDFNRFSRSLPDGYTPDGIKTTFWAPSADRHLTPAMTAMDGYLTIPIGSNDHQALALNLGGSWWEINETPVSHRGNSLVPRHLDGADSGLTFYQEWGPQDAVGAHFNIGSYGDRPFNRLRDWQYDFALLRQWPAETGASWLGGISFDTTGRLPAVPIPVFGYLFGPGHAWEGMLGFPGSSVTFHPTDVFGLHFEYTLLTSMRANVIVNFTEHLKMEAGTQWTNDFWYRSERIHDNEQLLYTEKRLFSELVWEMGQSAAFHIGGGWAFHRSFERIDGFWGREGPRAHLGTAPVFDLGLSLLY